MTLKYKLKQTNFNLREIYEIIERHPELEKPVQKEISACARSSTDALKKLKTYLRSDDINLQSDLFKEAAR